MLHVDTDSFSRNPQPMHVRHPTGDGTFFFVQVDLAKAQHENINLRALKNECCDNPMTPQHKCFMVLHNVMCKV